MNNIIIDKINKTINDQDPIKFINDFSDGTEDFYTEYEQEFVDALDIYNADTDEYIYNGQSYDFAYQVIYSDVDLIIQWFEYMINNKYL